MRGTLARFQRRLQVQSERLMAPLFKGKRQGRPLVDFFGYGLWDARILCVRGGIGGNNFVDVGLLLYDRDGPSFSLPYPLCDSI